MIEVRVNKARMQIGMNIDVLQDVIEWNTRNGTTEDYRYFGNSRFVLANGTLHHLHSRANDIAREVNSAMQQVCIFLLGWHKSRLTFLKAERVATHIHSTRVETFSWHNLKLNYTIESAIKQITILSIIFVPGIFTSVSTLVLALFLSLITLQTFFSSNFFITTQDLNFKVRNIWLWFAITVPLSMLVLLTIYILNVWRTKYLLLKSNPLSQNV
jgi:hypothetical protein